MQSRAEELQQQAERAARGLGESSAQEEALRKEVARLKHVVDQYKVRQAVRQAAAALYGMYGSRRQAAKLFGSLCDVDAPVRRRSLVSGAWPFVSTREGCSDLVRRPSLLCHQPTWPRNHAAPHAVPRAARHPASRST